MLPQYTDIQLGSANDLAAHIETLVLEGHLGPGDRLPTIRDMSGLVDLSPNTVAAAYRRLTRRGLIDPQGRRGTFVAATPAPPATEPPVPGDLIDLASGNPDPELLPDLDRHLAGLHPAKGLYGEPAIDPGFEAIARSLLAGDGIAVGTLAVVGGALDGVERALQAHLRIGDAVAVEAPGWPAFSDLVSAMGMRPVPVPIDDLGMVPDELVKMVGSVAAVVLTPRAQNPTGAAFDARRAAALRSVLLRHPEVLVIEDDHAGLISGVDLRSVGAGLARWVMIQSLSKSFGPDLRLACVTGDDITMGRITARQCAGPGWVSHILQRLAASVLEDPDTADLLVRATAEYGLRRETLLGALAGEGIAATGRTGLNVWAQVPDQDAAVAALADAGYAVRGGGKRWHMGTDAAIRISIGRMPIGVATEIAATLGRLTPHQPVTLGRLA